MTRAPVCPICGSTAVSPDASNGGAGRNVCHCGHRAPVRDFYEVPMSMSEYTSAATRYDLNRLKRRINETPLLAPGRVNYVTERVAAVLMPNGELNDMRHRREPAPIRQYKDED